MDPVIRIQNSWSFIENVDQVPDELINLLSYVDRQATFGRFKWSQKFEVQKKCIVSKRAKAFPSGVVPIVQERFPNWNYVDERIKPDWEWQPIPPEIENYVEGHQARAIEAMLRYGRGTVEGVTAMGKSFIEGGLASMACGPVLVISHRTEIANNIFNKCAQFSGYDDCGTLFPKRMEPKRVTVGMIKTIASNIDLLRPYLQQVEVLMVDESHHVSIKSQYFEVIQSCRNAYYRFGLTATPKRESGDTIASFSVTGPIIFTYQYQQAVEEGAIVPVEIYMVPQNPSAHMPLLDEFGPIYEKGVVHNPNRNHDICKIIRHLYHKGENVLVLVWRVPHGREISKLLEDVDHRFISGKSGDREAVKVQFENGDLPVLIASDIFGEGVDIERVQNVVNAAGYKSMRLQLQRIGRGLRRFEGKEKCRVFDFYDTCHNILVKQSKERLKLYKKMGYKINELHV